MNRLNTFKALTRDIAGIRKPLIALGFFKVWNLIFGLIPLFLYSYLVNRVLVDKNMNELAPVIIGYLAVFLFATIGIAISKRFSNRLILKYDLRIKNKLLKKYTSLDQDVYSKYSIGDVKSRIESDSIVAGNFFTAHILDLIYGVVYAVALAVILLCYDWRIALISFVFVPISFLTVNFVGGKSKKAKEELWKLQTKYETFLHSNIQNWKDIKINNLEDTQLDELNGHYKKIRPIWFLSELYSHLGITYSFFTKNFITQLFIYFIGGLFVINGYSQVGVLLVFISFYGQFFGNIENISHSIINFKNDSVNIEKVVEILNLEVGKRPYKKIDGADIHVENLIFTYGGNDSFTLDGISFSVTKGEHLAIVGKSGSGKSTIAKLLTGKIKPQGGIVRIGGIDIHAVNSESLSEKVSIVVQEPVLFNMTIRENLLLAKADATETELIDCCRRASIYDFIETLQNKLDTIIGEKGVKLSGGQRQRLSIARAFLQDRDIIIFDESTSALDNENENDIITELKSLSSGKTMISIAHRLSTILDCDKVMVLKEGAMVAFDTHDNLRNRNETYDLLFQNQYVAGGNVVAKDLAQGRNQPIKI
ncbi:ABC transporter ATP-binding protein [Paenibacillus sp.]|jgi:ATP-binding cassette subfamily B protein/subfamily B ATP-binding cassette protein MsbA|uniref:ABC transporter ATP-binding protein n=1 Tax=Paenibacillus sp. TaxID=58172 RepID=UPI002833CD71|nr:ABC transporter ATP-binding protein [Paenibacillus sp.]MDR0270841.1 ABC transporter ATP-binding protein/permease [Paenibacillus sp.]